MLHMSFLLKKASKTPQLTTLSRVQELPRARFKDKHDLMERIIIRKCALILRYVLEELMKKKETCRMSFPEQMLFITEKIIDYLEEHKEIITLIGKNFSSCLSYFNTIEDDRLKSMLSDLVHENLENGFSEHETLKRIYLIVTLVGSVCYGSLAC